MFGEQYRSKAPRYTVFSSILSLAPLKPKYISQHPFPNHPQPMIFHHCDRPSFTKVKTSDKSTVLDILVAVSWHNRRRKPVNRRLASTPRVLPSLTSFMDALIFFGRQEIEEIRGRVFDVEVFRR
jgi:hypothetical protein